MVNNATVVVDDQDKEIKYLCPVQSQTVSGSYFNNTWTTIASTTCRDGWFEYTFYGTRVRVVGSAINANSNHSVKIDDGPMSTQNGYGSYESPILPDGRHTITYASGALDLLPTFDYLVVTAGPSTPLRNRTLIVDNADPSFIYSGNWTMQPPKPLPSDLSTAPYKQTTRWSTTVGDLIQFNFTGTSVAVFGILSNISTTSNISATYTIDGVPSIRSVPKGALEAMPMTQLFRTDTDLQPGNHTLLVNITAVTFPQAIGFDFITYNASFSNVASMPGYTTRHSSSSSSVKHSVIVIANAVIGAVILVAVILLFFLWRKRHRDWRMHVEDNEKRSWSKMKALPDLPPLASEVPPLR